MKGKYETVKDERRNMEYKMTAKQKKEFEGIIKNSKRSAIPSKNNLTIKTIIENEKDHKEALNHINKLMDKKKKNAEDLAILDLLSSRVFEYEQANFKIERPNLYQRIKFRLDQKPIKYYIKDFFNFIRGK